MFLKPLIEIVVVVHSIHFRIESELVCMQNIILV
jgi:hypothetical protein